MNWLVQRFFLRFMRKLGSTVDGQRFMISQLVETEAMANGEGNMFPRLLDYVDEPRLHGLIQRHYDDEVRHEGLYRDVIQRIDSNVDAPQDIMVMRLLESMTRSFTDDPVTCDRDVFESYLFIQALEEQAEIDLPLLAGVFDSIDPVIAEVIRSVARDEKKHVRWCDPVVEAFAESPDDLRRSRRKFRAIAEFAHHRHNLLGADYAYRNGLVKGGALGRWAWRVLITPYYVCWGLWLKLLLGSEAPTIHLGVAQPGLVTAPLTSPS